MAKKTEEQKQEKIAKDRRPLRRENELLNLIEAEANIDLLCLDMGIEELKRKISMKKREVEALRKKLYIS